jgi:hypothetical protein
MSTKIILNSKSVTVKSIDLSKSQIVFTWDEGYGGDCIAELDAVNFKKALKDLGKEIEANVVKSSVVTEEV